MKSVSRESISETTDRVSREFTEWEDLPHARLIKTKNRDAPVAYSWVDPVCGAVGAIPIDTVIDMT